MWLWEKPIIIFRGDSIKSNSEKGKQFKQKIYKFFDQIKFSQRAFAKSFRLNCKAL